MIKGLSLPGMIKDDKASWAGSMSEHVYVVEMRNCVRAKRSFQAERKSRVKYLKCVGASKRWLCVLDLEEEERRDSGGTGRGVDLEHVIGFNL